MNQDQKFPVNATSSEGYVNQSQSEQVENLTNNQSSFEADQTQQSQTTTADLEASVDSVNSTQASQPEVDEVERVYASKTFQPNSETEQTVDLDTDVEKVVVESQADATSQSEANLDSQATSGSDTFEATSESQDQATNTQDANVDQPEVEIISEPELPPAPEPEVYKTPLESFFSDIGLFSDNQNYIVESDQLDNYIESQDFNVDDFLHFLATISQELLDLYNSQKTVYDRNLELTDQYKSAIEFHEKREKRLRETTNNKLKYAPEKLIKLGVRPLVTDLDNALQQLHKFPEKDQQPAFQELITCIETFRKDLQESLASKGHVVMYGKVGDKFDPNYHNALGQIPKATFPHLEHETVGYVASQGYQLYDRVVEPANVMVVIDPEQM